MSDAKEEAARTLLETVLPDENWDSDHLINTPKRFSTMLHELTHEPEFEFTTFPNELGINEMVVVSDIPFYSLCAHHIIPFYGKCHVAYIPDAKLCGLSKITRSVKYWSHGLWVQEHLTDMIALHLQENLRPQGLSVVMQAEHLCMAIRGVQTPGTKTTTSVMQGVFLDPTKQARAEFLSLIRKEN